MPHGLVVLPTWYISPVLFAFVEMFLFISNEESFWSEGWDKSLWAYLGDEKVKRNKSFIWVCDAILLN